MSAFAIYLVGIADGVKGSCQVAGVIFIVVSVICGFSLCTIHAEHGDDKELEASFKKAFKYVCIGLLVCFISLFIPSKETVAAMYILPRIEKSKLIQEDFPDIYNLAVEHLKKSLNVEDEKKGEK